MTSPLPPIRAARKRRDNRSPWCVVTFSGCGRAKRRSLRSDRNANHPSTGVPLHV